jgi:hypothetical protein
MDKRYIVSVPQYFLSIYDGHDIAEAHNSAESSELECSLYENNKLLKTYNKVSGWQEKNRIVS